MLTSEQKLVLLILATVSSHRRRRPSSKSRVDWNALHCACWRRIAFVFCSWTVSSRKDLPLILCAVAFYISHVEYVEVLLNVHFQCLSLNIPPFKIITHIFRNMFTIAKCIHFARDNTNCLHFAVHDAIFAKYQHLAVFPLFAMIKILLMLIIKAIEG